MSEHVILSAIGADRPGLVDEVSEFIFDRRGNIEDSRMVNLRGQFALMVLVGGNADVLKKLQADLPTIERQTGLRAEIRVAGAAPTSGGASAGVAIPYKLHATGLD